MIIADLKSSAHGFNLSYTTVLIDRLISNKMKLQEEKCGRWRI